MLLLQAKQKELASRRQQLSTKVEQLSASAGQVATPSRGSKVAADLSDAGQELDILTSILVGCWATGCRAAAV